MSARSRNIGHILSVMHTMQDEELLINFTAGVLLGKNRLAFLPGTKEQYDFFVEIHQVLSTCAERLAHIGIEHGLVLPRGVVYGDPEDDPRSKGGHPEGEPPV